MANPNQDNPNSTHRITPEHVEPEKRDSVGHPGDRSTGHDRGLRREPDVEEADGGDIAGVAGGSVDRKV